MNAADPGHTPDAAGTATPIDWRASLPVLPGRSITLRELRASDAVSLCALLATPDVARFISPPPPDAAGFEGFIKWTHRQRIDGRYVCFAVVPAGCDTAVGLFQIRELERGFGTAEWGFAIGAQYWGAGLFLEGAELVIDFAFAHIGAHRLEARAVVQNGRGNGALAKLGAAREAVLRSSFVNEGKRVDQNLWTIMGEDWRRAKAVWGPRIH